MPHAGLRSPRRAALAALGLLALAGCAATPSAPGPAAPGTPVFEEIVLAPGPAEPLAAGSREEALYKALVAEIAGQRGQFDVAVENYMDLLRRSPGDAALAERVTRVTLYAEADAEAYEAAQAWVRAEPSSLEARQALASLQLARGELDAAQANLEFVLDAPGSEAGEVFRSVVGLLGAAEDRQGALELMRRLAERRPADPDSQFAYALLAVRAERMPEARQAMERVLELTPANPGIVMAYLGILQKQGDTAAAAAWLESVLEQRPQDFDLRLIYARLLADEKRYAEARREFERLEREAPPNSDVQYALGLLLLQEDQPEKARVYFEKMHELGQNRAEASFYLGQIAEFDGRLDQALDYYRAVDGSEFLFDAQLRAAGLLARQGKFEEARAHLRAVGEANPELAVQAARAEAELLAEAGRLEEAMAVYDRALAPGYDADLLYARAMLAERLGRLEVLERDLRAIIEQDPDNAQALNALGYTLADRTDRHQEALELIERALKISPEDFYILDSMGWVLHRLGRNEEALEYLQRAQAVREDPEVAAHIVQVMLAKGDREGARRVLEAAEKAFPDNEKLRAVRPLLGP